MIIHSPDKCIGCGSCVKICHEHCMTLVDRTVSINQEICSTCTQCVAICPQQAISWDNIPPCIFEEKRLPSPEQIDELLKERRTIRFFKKKKLNRKLLEEIVSYGIYAPTNNYSLRAIIVDDEDIMKDFERILMQYVLRTYRFIFKPKVVFNLIRKMTPKIDPKDKVKMEAAIKRGYNFPVAPAIVFIVGDKRIALSEASAHYALYNMILYAQTKAIGSRLRGQGLIVYDRNKTARQRLRLSKKENILGMLELGYSAVRFRNKVTGKTLPIRWNAG